MHRLAVPTLHLASALMVAFGFGIMACDDPAPQADVADTIADVPASETTDTSVDAGPDTVADASTETDGSAGDAEDDGSVADNGPDTDLDVPACDIKPTLESLQTHYFGPSCANFASCHKGANPAGGLDLELDSHAAMVNVLSADTNAAAAGKLLVVPGDADASFVVQKVEGTMAADEGVIMPYNIPEPFDPQCRIQALRDWINAGAPAQ